MAGSGVNEKTVETIVRGSGVNEIHISALSFAESGMTYRNEKITAMGDDDGSEFRIRTVDPDRVRTIRRLAENAASGNQP